MIGILRGVMLTGVLLGTLGGGYLMSTTLQTSTQQTPQETADKFVRAIISNDVNEMGVLLGLDPKQGSPMEQTFGKVLGALLEDYADQQTQNPADYRWEIQRKQVTDSVAQLQVDFFAPDTAALVKRMEALMGYRMGPDDTLIIPDPLLLSYEEAERQARADPKLRPLHYRVPLRLVRAAEKWIIDPQADENDALVSVIRRGGTLTDNEIYLVK